MHFHDNHTPWLEQCASKKCDIQWVDWKRCISSSVFTDKNAVVQVLPSPLQAYWAFVRKRLIFKPSLFTQRVFSTIQGHKEGYCSCVYIWIWDSFSLDHKLVKERTFFFTFENEVFRDKRQIFAFLFWPVISLSFFFKQNMILPVLD